MKWHSKQSKPNCGFTLLDLTVLIAVVFGLAALTAPVFGNGRQVSAVAICLANKQALMRAWQLYAADNDDRMPSAIHGGRPISSSPSAIRWCEGWLDWNNSSDNTNHTYLTGSLAQLGRYINSNRFIFKCPEDRYLSRSQKAASWKTRVRSVSGNIAVGEGNAEGGPWNNNYEHLRKISDFHIPGPGSVFVYLDEHPDSLNDPAFFPPSGSANALSLIDVPSALHNGAGAFGFGDGHAELHQWQTRLRDVRVTFISSATAPGPIQPDLRYLYDHTPRTH